MGWEAVVAAIERMLCHPEVVRLMRSIPRSAESRAERAHTRLGTTKRTLEMEQAECVMATDMAAEIGHGLPAQAIEQKTASLNERGYPLSDEQSLAIRHATAQGRPAPTQGELSGSQHAHVARPNPDGNETGERSLEYANAAPVW